jgi:hypothetical protein
LDAVHDVPLPGSHKVLELKHRNPRLERDQIGNEDQSLRVVAQVLLPDVPDGGGAEEGAGEEGRGDRGLDGQEQPLGPFGPRQASPVEIVDEIASPVQELGGKRRSHFREKSQPDHESGEPPVEGGPEGALFRDSGQGPGPGKPQELPHQRGRDRRSAGLEEPREEGLAGTRAKGGHEGAFPAPFDRGDLSDRIQESEKRESE